MWTAVGACAMGALVCLFLSAYLGGAGDSYADFSSVLLRAAIGLGLFAGVLAVVSGTRWTLEGSRGESAGMATRGRVGRRAVRDRLTSRLRESGGLMNQRPSGSEELRRWIGRVQGWYDATYSEIAQHVSSTEAAQFGDPRPKRRQRKFVRAVNDEHSDWLARLDEWRDRLRDVIGRL